MTDFHKTKTKINSMKESIVKDKLTIKFLNKMLHTWTKTLLNLELQELTRTTINKNALILVILQITETEKIQETSWKSYKIKRKNADLLLMKYTQNQISMEEIKDEIFFYLLKLFSDILWIFSFLIKDTKAFIKIIHKFKENNVNWCKFQDCWPINLWQI